MEQCRGRGFVHQILDSESNSIAIVAKHMAGTHGPAGRISLTTDGEKPDRNRDSEFEDAAKNTRGTVGDVGAGWRCVFDALAGLSDADLGRTITIRGEPHSVMQAINRQVAHYAYHVGQITFVAKHLAAEQGNWTALTVPRKQSSQFNADVARGKSRNDNFNPQTGEARTGVPGGILTHRK